MRAGKLIDILKTCGISQQQIADRLGIAKTAVSAWAHGTRPMPHKHELVLLSWTQDAQQTALEHARVRDTAAAPRRSPSLLGSENPEEDILKARLRLLWDDYNWAEAEEETRGLTTAILAQVQGFARYADAEPSTTTLKQSDIAQLKTETSRLRALLNKWERIQAHPQGDSDAS